MIKFGTDGWRAIISDEFTFENVRLVAQATADFFKKQKKGKRRLIVGYDTRFLSAEYAQAISEVLAGNGFKVILTNKPTPTPVISFTIKHLLLDGGIVVTASHNPAQFNGFKVKAAYGGPAQPETTKAIEKLVGKHPVKILSAEAAQKKKLLTIKNIDAVYLSNLKKYLNMKVLKRCSYRVLFDAMYGTGVDYIASVLKDTSIKIDQIRTERNPGFAGIRPEPIPENLEPLIEGLKTKKYALGIANDGDADRFGFIAPGGRFVTPGEVLGLVILHLIEQRKWKGSVVKTLSNSSLINAIAEQLELKLYETPVGFKHIGKYMVTKKILAGGEESGGLGVMNYVPERDGILLGLLMLEIMATRKKSIGTLLRDMERRFGAFKYCREDIEIPEKNRATLMRRLLKEPPTALLGKKIVQTQTIDGIKFIAEDKSWLLFRLSGTEPILRIYTEAANDTRAKALITFGKKLAMQNA